MQSAEAPPPADSVPAPDRFGLLAFGGSAGAIPALKTILSGLPGDFPIPIVVVQHLNAGLPSQLPEVLGQRAALRCRWARHGEKACPGTVLIAPPGANLTFDATGRLALVTGSKPRLGWPSIDVFLLSAAALLGPRLIAVVLSGALYDGSDGIRAVRRAGGTTIAQDVSSADFPEMPIAAVELGEADQVLPVGRICKAVQRLARRGTN